MHLSELFLPLFAAVSGILRELELKQPPYHEVRERIITLLEASSRPGESTAEELNEARFPLCAWIDEQIAKSRWEHKELWLKEQLQRGFFNTTEAGVEFFARLEKLSPRQRDLREIFYLCLMLGFTGRFCTPADQSHLEQLKLTQLKMLVGSAEATLPLAQRSLFPESGWSACNGGNEPPRRFPVASALFLAAPLLLLALLFLLYRFTLSSVGENFLKTVAN